MATLIERVRAARETWVQVQGYELLLRRPTGLEIAEIGGDLRRLIKTAVVGWRLKEVDLVPGGDGSPAPFDPDLCLEWLADQPDAFNEVLEQIRVVNARYLEQIAATEKK